MDGRAKSTKINSSSHLSPARNEQEKALLHEPTIRPVPGLLAKLSQAFVSFTVIFFLVSAWRLYRTRAVLYDIVARAESTMTDNCQAVEKTMSVLAHSLPAIAVQGVSRGLVLAVISAIVQIGHGLEIVLVGIMATISWVISVLTGTWRCFLLHLSETRLPILSELGTRGVEALDQLNSALTTMMFMPLNDLGALIHREMAFPQFENLLATVPTFTRVQFRLCDKIKDALSLEQLEKELDKMTLRGVVVLVGMVRVWYQHRRWRLQIDRVAGRLSCLSGGQGNGDQGHDPNMRHGSRMVNPPAEQSLSEYEAIEISQMIKQPLLYRFVDSTSKRLFPKDKDKQRVYSWLINYVCTPPTMACLVLGLFGIVLVHCQIAFVLHIAASYQPLLSKPLVDITALVLETINDDILRSASRNFAAETNRSLAQLETDINTVVFSSDDNFGDIFPQEHVEFIDRLKNARKRSADDDDSNDEDCSKKKRS
ncbi:plasma membrane fusion protein prm1 [Lunasporangiospora selenospora]|uniref:Plasma membrane fusion protein PRM1 n=1 Tax=Lunasporangiospora selenospora TaxID=979761 RepID=A0A9P6G057_9FUNG|nr:plasma membrane fusion protein prm1 [Lunasporangiospora selenospora]